MALVYQIITVWPRHSRLRERFKSRDDESTTFQHRRHTTSGLCHSFIYPSTASSAYGDRIFLGGRHLGVFRCFNEPAPKNSVITVTGRGIRA